MNTTATTTTAISSTGSSRTFQFRSALASLALISLSLTLSPSTSSAQDSKSKSASLDPNDWAHLTSDVDRDPAVKFGKLPNGLRYAIMKNAEPPKRASMRLFVRSGSLQEAEDQRGLAHFIEHMAFNGTRNFPGTEIVEYLQRLGMGFGNHLNAHTSFNETVYKLEIPEVTEKYLEQSMQVFRDYADGMLFDEQEIENERGVILSEKLARDSIQFRVMEVGFKFNMPDLLLTERMPIGTEKVIKEAKRDRFLAYYNKFYTPDRMAVVVVGDVDPDAIAKLVEKHFASMKRPTKPVPDPDMGKLTPRGIATMLHPEKEAGSTTVSMTTLQPYRRKPDTLAERTRRLPLDLANSMVNQRLEILSKSEEAPFAGGGLSASDFFDSVFMGDFRIICDHDQWKDALALGEQQLRKAITHGFTENELSVVKARIQSSYEQLEKSSASRKSRGLSTAIAQSISAGKVFTNPAYDLAWISKALDGVTADDCARALRKQWDTENINIFVTGNIQAEKGGDQILVAYKKSREVAVEAPEKEDKLKFAYRDFGAAGKVVSRKEIKDLGITQLTFANNVKVNLKKTGFAKNSISIHTRIAGGGLLTLPKGKPGLQMLAGRGFDLGGLEAHSTDDLQKIFAGKNVNSAFTLDEDAFAFTGRTTPEDLQDQLDLTCAYLTASGYRKDVEVMMGKMVPFLYQQIEHTAQGVMMSKGDAFLHSGDYRFAFPSQAELMKRSMEEVKQWFDPIFKKAPLEVSVVGDFDTEAIIPMLARTYGALAKRDTEIPPYSEERKVNFPRDIREKIYPFETKIPKSLTTVYWPTTDASNPARTRRLSILGSILGDRLRVKIREELGETYSPNAGAQASENLSGYGYIVGMVEGKPEQAAMIANLLIEIAHELSAEGTSEDELLRVLKPIQNSLVQQRRNNAYWLSSVLAGSQEKPERLARARTLLEDFGAITVSEINALAKEYLGKDKSLKMIMMPKVAGEK